MELSEASVAAVKSVIKQFEQEFKLANSRPPTREDIEQNPKIRKYYKFISKFKAGSGSIRVKPNSTSPKTIQTPTLTSVSPITSTTVTTTTTSVNFGSVWGKSLNKKPGTAESGDKDLKQFNSVSLKVTRLNEEFYREEAKSNKKLSYSLRHKKAHLLEKSKVASEEARQIVLASKNAAVEVQSQTIAQINSIESAKMNEFIQANSFEVSFKGFDLFTESRESISPQPQSLVIPPPVFTVIKPQTEQSALSLLESMANGGTVTQSSSFNDFGNDFVLDNVNDFIKNSILDNGALEFERRPKNESGKRPIYDLENDNLYSIRKKVCTTKENLSISRDSAIEVSSSSSRDSYDLNTDLSTQPQLTTSITLSSSPIISPPKRKFFKSDRIVQNRSVEYSRTNFMDHHKVDEFEFENENDKDYVPDLYKGNNKSKVNKEITNATKPKKLTNVTNNQNSDTQKTVEVSEKTEKKKATRKPKAPKGNFVKLNIKKKAFVRGHKKFNMKQYKFKSWKANKNKKKYDNKCFKCGESDHWANACPHAVSSQPSSLEEGAVESAAQNHHSATLDQTYDICLDKPLFTDLDDPELDMLVDEALTEFGFEQFRPNQKLTVKRILCAKSTLLVSPTGFGKSLCYQLAAYCFWKKRHLITLVVSPLISLMQDQLINFPSVLKPVAWNSSKSDKEKEEAINAIIYGKAQVLFLSPECVVSGLYSINFNTFARVAFVCIDEAHCLAEWSTNFRPSYLHLYKVLRYKLNIRTILAMTATVTKDTSRIICKNLQLDPQEDVVGSTRVPDNLVLTISKKTNKLTALIDLLKSDPYNRLKSIIIYCTKREQTTQLETQIRTLLQFDLPPNKVKSLVRAYHAGLGAYERTSIQDQFIKGKLRIVVATIAFGMGINKSDIRGIIHYNMPKSFENYIQEIGRAGRDGQTAYCHLFLDTEGEDLFNLQSYIYANGVDKPTLKRLVSKIYPPCKCDLLAAESDNDEDTLSSEPKSNCKGHPVALPITPTEIEIDIKSENIYTLMMNLELSWPSAPIHVYSPTNSTATIVNFGDESDMYALVKQSPIIQMGATLTKQECKAAFDFSNFKFSVVKVAAMLGMDVNRVKSELKRLEWTTDPSTGRRKKSHVSVRFGDYSYLMRSPGNLTEEQIGEVTEFLYNSIEQYETKEIYKLRFVYSKFNEFVTLDCCEPNEIEDKSDRLKDFINSYFYLDTSFIPLDLDSSNLSLPFNFDFQNQDSASILSVISEFIHIHHAEGVNTPRKIARILQGISSPKFPVEIWGKARRFWRCLPTIDFKHLMDLCRQAMINTYSLPGPG